MNFAESKVMKSFKIVVAIVAIISSMVYMQSCNKENWLISIPNNLQLKNNLSEYQIFQGSPSDLSPTNGFHLYELSTQLFTDYAEKQRLIKLPSGTVLQPTDDNLPQFPEGTILVKTFFYYKDKRNLQLGKKIIETRLLIKHEGKWNVGTYKWNETQTDATLITTGFDEAIAWKDEYGATKNISYHIPNTTECNTCHQSDKISLPIGPKLRNLNRDVIRNGSTINQLLYLQNQGIFHSINPADYSKLPDWQNTSNTIEQRARAYMDVNCAHCHNDNGVCKRIVFRPAYETPFGKTYLTNYKKLIIIDMEKKSMPKLGTTITHAEGIEILKQYFSTF